jgi:hypothetical protein
MGTVNKSIADRAIAGEFPEDEIVRIVRYKNQFNGEFAYGLVYKGDDPRKYHLSPACSNCQIYWELGDKTARL